MLETTGASMTDHDRALTPVEITGIGPTGKPVTLGIAMRRQSEARLWAWLGTEPDFERAVNRIMWAWQSFGLLPGLQPSKAPSWQQGRVNGGSSGDGDMVGLMDARKDYYLWAARCDRDGIAHGAAMDVLGTGKSLRVVDRERRCRKGWARDNLGAALALYCAMQGWRKAA
jgi:hypothetical protein